MITQVNLVLWSMTAMATLGVASFFLRFWRQTHDRLFLFLAIAFALFAINWLLLAVAAPARESRHLVYLLRLAGFGIIIAGIIDKNRGPAGGGG
jgi:hypothetical protein